LTTLHLDLETFSEVPITHGTHAYAERAEVLLVAVAVDDAPVDVWDTQDRPDWRSDLQRLINDADTVVIHNSHFDRTVLRHCGVTIPVEKIEDTMVLALQHSLPASLGALCDVLDVPSDIAKDKAGRKLIQLFCKPRGKNVKLRRADRDTHPAEWAAFVEYARLDVDAMRDVRRRLPRWNNSVGERELWRLDQRINDGGIAVDVGLARAALRAFERTSRSLAVRSGRLTNGAVGSLTQRAKLLDYLRGVLHLDIADLTKATVAGVLQRKDLHPEARELLEIRQQAAATSPAKYGVIINAASSDGRLRGIIQFCGASRTGRDAGRLFQPQNLPRTFLKPDYIESGIAAMKLDCEDLLIDNVSELCTGAVRGCLIAEPGKKLVISDLSNIEGRVLAWLAGEQWKVDAFYAFDRGEGHDLYVVAYSKAFGVEADVVVENKKTSDGTMRQYGKVMELAGGYGGGVGAYRTMGGAAVDALKDDAIQTLVTSWRKAHPKTVALWHAVERAARAAIDKPLEEFPVGALSVGMKDKWLRIKLPSGRYLSYPDAAVNDDGRITHSGVNQFTKKWETLETYGGKLCIAQGTLVLTDAGWLPIEWVTSLHKLWDGVEWVANTGLANNGVKGVIQVSGVWMTPDHEVLTTGGWVRASQSEGLERADPRIPYGCQLPREQRTPITVVAPLRVRDYGDTRRFRDSETAEAGRSRIVRLYAQQDHSGKTNLSRNVAPQSVRGMAEHVGPMHAAHASGLEELRGAWHSGLRQLAAFFFRLLGRHGSDVQRGAYAGSTGQQRELHAGELPLGQQQKTSAEQAKQFSHRNTVGTDNRGRSGGSVRDEPLHFVLSGESGRAGSQVVRGAGHIAQVYDIMNCGPRQRFVVASEGGDVFIVHNCENIVQAVARDVFMVGMRNAEAAGYPVCIRVHDELITETPDTAEYNVDRLSALMATNPSWAAGLPLRAAGFETHRYRKD
jgi:DNA polymerase